MNVERCDSPLLTRSRALSHDTAELVLRVRSTLLADLRESEARRRIDDEPSDLDELAKRAERTTLLTLSKIARAKNRNQVALNAVLKSQQIIDRADYDVTFATASVLWLQGESGPALKTLEHFLNSTYNIKADQQAMLLSQMVSAESKSHAKTMC